MSKKCIMKAPKMLQEGQVLETGDIFGNKALNKQLGRINIPLKYKKKRIGTIYRMFKVDEKIGIELEINDTNIVKAGMGFELDYDIVKSHKENNVTVIDEMKLKRIDLVNGD